MLKKLLSLMVPVLLFYQAAAQPFSLQSTTGARPFILDIYFGTEGKGAFVQYRGQQGIISLRLETRSSHGSLTAPKVTYVWDEVIGGKVTGSYGLTQEAGKLSGIWYKRSKDGKQFQLEQIIAPGDEARIDKYLLHDVLISFRHTSDNLLIFSYGDGSTKTSQLPGFDHPDPRRLGTIADYNFDGFDDVAFSIPDEGMGVYRNFTIYLYNPKSKRFHLLAEPNATQGKCSGLCDVTLDKKNKLLMSSCRGGATWWTDVYRYSNSGKLTWVKSSKQQ
ncbi:XAC2610-related protein [Pedobacter sp. P26]|uniref:XAC2610-related protein n=1 Tax=Pedobacter sp. P26 TaxID=3423956 RepID=UPI003D66C427